MDDARLGSAPLTVAVVTSLARVFSVIEASWFTEYALLLAIMFDLPMLQAALNSRSRERRSSRLRQLAAESQDPLTGLPKGKHFFARLLHALQRYATSKEPTAIVLLELNNYSLIRDHLGTEAAEESLLRTVIKLRSLLRDIDIAGRVSEARFGILLAAMSPASRRPIRFLTATDLPIGVRNSDGLQSA